MYRNTFLEINVNNLYHNVDTFLSRTNKKLIAVVKANAYGMTDYMIASLLEKKGVDFFAVSSLEEALRLRKHNIKSNILIMGYVRDLDIVKENDFSIITPNLEYVNKYKDDLKGVKVHIKVNTGLNRLGVFPSEANETLNILLNSAALVEGIMTHYACGDDIDYTYTQYYLFKDTIEKLNFDFKYIHSTATDAALTIEDEISNYSRIGLGLFGYANIEHDWDLKPVISLKAEVLYCKQLVEGDGVSYGHHYISDGKGYIITAAIGYADGLERKIQGHRVFVNDEECEVVGTVCMDLIMIHSNEYHEAGELVEIIGDHITIEERKDDYETCCCKVLTDISDRVSRIYKLDGEIVGEVNERQ